LGDDILAREAEVKSPGIVKLGIKKTAPKAQYNKSFVVAKNSLF
jgi:hypothetical protein